MLRPNPFSLFPGDIFEGSFFTLSDEKLYSLTLIIDRKSGQYLSGSIYSFEEISTWEGQFSTEIKTFYQTLKCNNLTEMILWNNLISSKGKHEGFYVRIIDKTHGLYVLEVDTSNAQVSGYFFQQQSRAVYKIVLNNVVKGFKGISSKSYEIV